MSVRILIGDCREKLRELPDASVNCCVTSPPYFGLRDYGVAGQLGLEPTPEEFVAALVDVFREVRRVLRDDGTLWLNLGDSYWGSWGNAGSRPELDGKTLNQRPKTADYLPRGGWDNRRDRPASSFKHQTLKAKDRIMLPARAALALQGDGWWLRDEIVWHKPNPMPSSVEDRTTPAHEMVYLLTKSARYSFDAAAIAEAAVSDHPSGNGFKREARLSYQNEDGSARGNDEQWQDVGGTKNRRSVWTVPVRPFNEAHFATFPPALIEPCILAGCPKGGTVLDPFGGAGTTGLVADRLQRDAILIELNPEYAAIAQRRIGDEGGMFTEVLAA